MLEKIHTALDASGIDGILWFIGKNADLAEKFMKALPKQEEDWLLDMMRADVNAKVANPEADIGELASQTTSRWLSMGDAAETFGGGVYAEHQDARPAVPHRAPRWRPDRDHR